MQRLESIKRFFSKIVKTKACWEWQAGKDSDGYGKFWSEQKTIRAHRFSWELHNKTKIPKNMWICHTCDNPSCVNPDHLYLGTATENNRDTVRRNRNTDRRGIKHPLAKLNESDVFKIKELCKIKTKREVSKLFPVNEAQIGRIVNSLRWAHV